MLHLRLPLFLLLGVLAWGGAASPALAAGKAESRKMAVKNVRQTDGSVVQRLALPARKGGAAPEDWLQRMADPARNGLACKDPMAFQEWMDAVTEPRFMTALASMAMEPGAYPKALGQLFNPATAHNWTEFTDPVLYLRWMGAGLDPKFYAALFNRLANPDKLGRWAASPASPELQALVLSALNPGAYGTRMAQAVDSRTYAPMFQAANPALPAAWAGEIAKGVERAANPQEWLKLETPDPKANPWLAGVAGYRY